MERRGRGITVSRGVRKSVLCVMVWLVTTPPKDQQAPWQTSHHFANSQSCTPALLLHPPPPPFLILLHLHHHQLLVLVFIIVSPVPPFSLLCSPSALHLIVITIVFCYIFVLYTNFFSFLPISFSFLFTPIRH